MTPCVAIAEMITGQSRQILFEWLPPHTQDLHGFFRPTGNIGQFRYNSKGNSAKHLRTWLATALALLATLGAALAALASNALSAQPDGLRALNGEWIYVEDRTERRSLEQLGPPMASKFAMSVEEGAVILNGHGSGHRDVRIAHDGSITEVVEANQTVVRYHGAWKDGTFEYEVAFERAPGAPDGIGLIRRKFRITTDGLIVSVVVDPPAGKESVGLYRHAESRGRAPCRVLPWPLRPPK